MDLTEPHIDAFIDFTRPERVSRLRCMTCNEEFTGFNPYGECMLCYVTYGAWTKEQTCPA